MDFSSLPRFDSSDDPTKPVVRESELAVPSTVREVTCPSCGCRTNHIQAYEIPFVMFILVYVIWTHATVDGCPRCVRASLWRQFWVSLPAANIFFPIVGPLIFRQISATDEDIVPSIPPEYYEWAHIESGFVPDSTNVHSGRGLRLLLALGLVACLAVTLFVVLPLIIR